MHVIAGVDLAWMGQRNPTAIAVGKLTPEVVELSSIIAGLHGTQSVIEALAGIVGPALDAFRLLLRADEDAALQRFEDAVYRWNDIAILTFIESELVSRPKFHSAIAGWINLTYSPALRTRLEPLARQITADPNALEDWARNLLRGRGFLPSDRVDSWETYVRMKNTRV